MRDAVARAFRPMPVGVSSSYFKVIRPPVSLEGDLGEFRTLSGLANGADAWADEVRTALLAGFEERLRVRGSLAVLGGAREWPLILRSLELERAVADLKGALEREVDSAAIPAEGLLALVIGAQLPQGGLTP
jgi:autotransporter translocation and assembly factor TamB